MEVIRRKEVFLCILEGLAAASATPTTITTDATYLKAHRRHRGCGFKEGLGRMSGRTKDGMNTNFHAVTDADGRPLSFS